MKKLFLGSDHGGFALKQKIRGFLAEHYADQFEVTECGCETNESCDYPVFGKAVAENVVNTPESLGIVICGSGLGISMAANRVKGVRAALANSAELARLGREHNGANVLAIGERTQFIDPWEDIVQTFLDTPADSGERHVWRRELLDQ